MNDPVPRYLAINAGMGVAFAFLFASSILLTDALGLRSLISASADCPGTVVIFLLGSIATFVPLVICTAVGTLRNSNV